MPDSRIFVMVMYFFPAMKILFLGTGTSHGVPPLDCMISDYARCKKTLQAVGARPETPPDRSSLLVEWEGRVF